MIFLIILLVISIPIFIYAAIKLSNKGLKEVTTYKPATSYTTPNNITKTNTYKPRSIV